MEKGISDSPEKKLRYLTKRSATKEKNNKLKKEKDPAVPNAIMMTVIVKEKTVEIEKISEIDVIEGIEKENEDTDIETRIYDHLIK